METASPPEMLVPLSTELHGITLTFIRHDTLVIAVVTEFTEFSPVLMTHLWKCHSDITFHIINWQNYIPLPHLTFCILLCLSIFTGSNPCPALLAQLTFRRLMSTIVDVPHR